MALVAALRFALILKFSFLFDVDMMDNSKSPSNSFQDAASPYAHGSLFSVFFLDPVMASKRLAELTEFAISRAQAEWTEKAAINRALALVIPRANECVAAQCAQALALNHCVDRVLADAFLARRDQSSRIILSESSAISQRLSLQIAALGSDDEARALTARHDLDEMTLHILLNRRDRPIDILIAENQFLNLSRFIVERLLTRAMIDPALCRSLIDRRDITLKDRASLFVHAATAQRETIINEVAVLFQSYDGELMTEHDTLEAELSTHLAAYDFAGFIRTLAQHLEADNARLAVALMEPSGGVLLLISTMLGAHDAFLDRMQRAWARPSPQEPRKRHALDLMRRQLTPAIAGFILDSILAVPVSEDRDRLAREIEVDAQHDPANKTIRERLIS